MPQAMLPNRIGRPGGRNRRVLREENDAIFIAGPSGRVCTTLCARRTRSFDCQRPAAAPAVCGHARARGHHFFPNGFGG